MSAPEIALIDATLALTARLDERQTCSAMLDATQRIFGAESCWILLKERGSNDLVTVAFRGPGADAYAGARVPCDAGIVGLAFARQETVYVPDVRSEERWYSPDRVRAAGLRSVFTVPLISEGKSLGVVGLDSPRFSSDAPPGGADISRLKAIAAIAAACVRNARTLEAVEQDRGRLRSLLEERRSLREQVGHLREQVREVHGSDLLVGDSEAFRDVLSQVALVAPADSTALLIGETGTGKEMVARALHEQSRRARHPFIAVNCAALPDSLIESELFGYERGAFTGALTRKPGKFELADRGTLFLDEIGDLPLPAQAKLLRVLQEREVQRVGGTRPVPVNVRLIAATNQDLDACIRTGRFRADLFFRLSVFPIRLPPLRDRRDDIAALVNHFVRRFAARQHKPVPRLAPRALQRLIAYEWPGNVRELQNVVERAVILSRGPVLEEEVVVLEHAGIIAPTSAADLGHSRAEPIQPPDGPRADLPGRDPLPPSNVISFRDAERHAIQRALETTGWRISGAGGAAQLLGLKPTTLHAKMKRLGIRRPSGAAAFSRIRI